MRLSERGAKIIAVFLLGGIAMLGLGAAMRGVEGGGWAGGTLAIVGGLWVLGALIALAVALRMWRRARLAEEVRRRGLRGEATIVEVIGARTATLDAVLDIRLPGHAVRRERRQLFVGPEAGHGLQPGMTLTVFANPDDPDDLLVGL